MGHAAAANAGAKAGFVRRQMFGDAAAAQRFSFLNKA
jgi:hypothetical protein